MDPRGLVAIGVAAVLLGSAFQGTVARAMLLVAGLAFAGAAARAIALRLGRARDPYDLATLRRIDEEAALEEPLDLVVASDADTLVCPRCGEPNPTDRPLCRRCKAPLP